MTTVDSSRFEAISDVAGQLVARGVRRSEHAHRQIWVAAGLPDGRPYTGWRAEKKNAAVLARLDDAARGTAMLSDEPGRSREYYDRLLAAGDLLHGATSALEDLLGRRP
ncbi:hypothetical protein [Petropleomorpha daqingensis]|uniref:Uncharacterized protein n=1 Tax=Petropleomorpha daqingensis TaxID=2026353 RepID=A0A853CFW6_9ACTN|nr:hypothetical protein [Petropleomorpha daqingensis]NYJ05889.1 hypothetical protein [Petropleomorpha daqingensis]